MQLNDIQPHFDDLMDAYRDLSTHGYGPVTNLGLVKTIQEKLAAILAVVDA